MKQKAEVKEPVSIPGKIHPWMPRIHQSFGNLLILDSFSGDPTCTFGPWPPCGKEGQSVTLRIESSGAEPLLVRNGEAITDKEAEEGVSSTLRRNWFEALAPNSEFSMNAEIALCSDEDSIVEFSPRFYSVKKSAGRAEFNEAFDLYESSSYNLGNGLVISRSSDQPGAIARATRNPLPNPEPSWGEGCFHLRNSSVRLTFANPVSFFAFSLVGQPVPNRSKYHYKEVGVPFDGYGKAWPGNGGVAQPSTQVLIESTHGVEYVTISHFDSSDLMYIDNMVWSV